MSPPLKVTPDDVAALLKELDPGTLYPAAELLARHNRLRELAGRSPDSARGLGLALRRADGWSAKLVRKSKGSRTSRVVTETSCWRTPGGPDPEAHVTLKMQAGAVQSQRWTGRS